MDRKIDNLIKRVDAIYGLLSGAGASRVSLSGSDATHRRETELEGAIRKAIVELDGTRNSFKSRQIMRIREELSRAVGEKG